MISTQDISLGLELTTITLDLEFNRIDLGMSFYEGYHPVHIPYAYPWLFGDETEMLYGDLTIMITYL